MPEKKIVILDAHPVFTKGLKHIIDNEDGFSVVDCCHNLSDLELSLAVIPADILIVDCSGQDDESELKKLITHLYAAYPEMAIVMLGESHRHQHLCREMQDNVKAYLSKTFSEENIIKGLGRVRHFLLKKRNNNSTLPPINEVTKSEELPWLTKRERKVIECLQSGFSVTQTARHVNRSVKTISTQKRTAMRKLGITSEKELYQLNINRV